MKKTVLLIFAALLGILLLGCGKDSTEFVEPANFYYLQRDISYNSTNGVICPETVDIAEYDADPMKILNAYLGGPKSQDLISPIPFGVRIQSCSIQGQEALLTLSREFSVLSGVKLSSACSCIALTLGEFADVETVRFQIDEELLDGKEQIAIMIPDIILLDDALQKG